MRQRKSSFHGVVAAVAVAALEWYGVPEKLEGG